MQIIESSIFGVSAVKYTLKSPKYQTDIVIFPMIHIAEKEFYNKIHEKLNECAFFLFEGVPGIKTKLIAASYKLLKFRKDLNLVSQSDSLPLKRYGNKGIHADFNQADNDRNWAILPFSQKLLFTIIAPLYGVFRFLTATRESIGKSIGVDNLKSREDILLFEGRENMEDYLCTEREKILIDRLSQQLKLNLDGKLGIIYGANHMGTIINFLIQKHDFIISDSEKITAIEY